MKNIKKIICGVLAIVIVGTIMTACSDTAESQQVTATNAALDQMNKQIGMPAIKNFQEKKTLKHIYELRDKSNLICYWYTKSEMTGKYIYEGKCIGFGIPYSTEYTNPQKYEGNGAVMPQADPNGLYAPSSADATWVDTIDDNGNEQIQCVEEKVTTSETKKDKRLCESWSLPSDY